MKWQRYITPDRSTNPDVSLAEKPASVQAFEDAKSEDTNSTQPNALKIPKDSHSIGSAMAQHGLLQQSKAFEKYPVFKEGLNEIIDANRPSAMKKKQLLEFKEQQRHVERLNESTFLQNLLPLIIKRKYTGLKDLEGGEQEQFNKMLEGITDDTEKKKLQSEHLYSGRYWINDGMLATMNSEFRRTLLPSKYHEEGFQTELAKALAKKDDMKNPRPDYTYGITPESFPVPIDVRISAETSALLKVVPGLLHPFFIIEGKADNGELAHAQNQACRGGATLVNAARILLEKIGEPDVKGVDERTFIFSATMTPGLMEIWVHWAEVMEESGTIFHMNRLVSRALNNDDHVVKLRKELHNIINWGCNTRRPELAQLHGKLHEHQRRETREMVQQQEANKSKKRKIGGRTPASNGSGKIAG